MAKVDKVDGIDAKPPLPGSAPLIDETHKSNVLTVLDVIVLAWIELVKNATVDRLEGMLANRPTNP